MKLNDFLPHERLFADDKSAKGSSLRKENYVPEEPLWLDEIRTTIQNYQQKLFEEKKSALSDDVEKIKKLEKDINTISLEIHRRRQEVQVKKSLLDKENELGF